MSDISSIRIDNTVYNIKDNNAPRKNEIYTTTQIDNLLNNKINTNEVYTSTQVDTLLNNKVNTNEIGELATKNDAPSDNKTYGRKNGTWSEVTETAEWGGITGDLSNQADLQTILDNKANTNIIPKRQLLWTNSRPNNVMATSTSISLSSSDYDILQVEVKRASSSTGNINIQTFPKGANLNLFFVMVTVSSTTNTWISARPIIRLSDTSFESGECALARWGTTSGGQSYNSLCIPINIYGVKYG